MLVSAHKRDTSGSLSRIRKIFLGSLLPVSVEISWGDTQHDICHRRLEVSKCPVPKLDNLTGQW